MHIEIAAKFHIYILFFRLTVFADCMDTFTLKHTKTKHMWMCGGGDGGGDGDLRVVGGDDSVAWR